MAKNELEIGSMLQYRYYTHRNVNEIKLYMTTPHIYKFGHIWVTAYDAKLDQLLANGTATYDKREITHAVLLGETGVAWWRFNERLDIWSSNHL